MLMVVEATLEEQVSKIREVIKGFHTRIEDLESPHQGHHQRKRNKEKELL
jgi:hypothetical protein